jgi:hypothetical protein
VRIELVIDIMGESWKIMVFLVTVFVVDLGIWNTDIRSPDHPKT